MKKLLLLCVLAVAVGGCSPSEKSIQKAIARGDDQYIREYLNNPKYWDDPNKSAVNIIALEGLVLLNQIDNAVAFYKVNKGTAKEDMIVKAFVNALAKSTPQKMPEKLVELIDDGRNNSSDVLLRETAVKIEQSLSVGKIKAYIERAVENRKNANIDSSIDFVNKAISWDIKSTLIPDVAKTLISQYSELKSLYDHINLESKNEKLKAIGNELGRIKQEEDRLSNQRSSVINNYNDGTLSSQDKVIFSDALRNSHNLGVTKNEKNKAFEDLLSEIFAIEKSMPEYEAKIKAKIPEVEAAETQLMEKLNAQSVGGAPKAPNLAAAAPSKMGFGRTTPLATLLKKDETRLIAEKPVFFS